MGRVFPERATLVGHRGMGQAVVDGFAPNTLESFLAALRAGIGWLEVDVQRSADNELFVHHDACLDDGRVIVDLSARDLTAAGVVSVAGLLRALPAEAGVVFDVKSTIDDAGRAASATTAALLAESYGSMVAGRPAVALSFDPAALMQMRRIAPELALGLLTWLRFPLGHAVAAAAHLDVEVLAVHAGSFWRNTQSGLGNQPRIEEAVTRLHDLDRELVVWCPSERRARTLAAAGVDAMIVDDVPRHVLHRQHARTAVRL